MEQQLIAAARNGSNDEIRRLLQQGVNLNYRDGSRKTALIWASKYGHQETVQLLLNKSSNVSSVSYSSDSGWSPLHYAASSGSVPLAILLMEKGAHVMAKNAAGETPLHLAGKNGHTDTARALIEMGANVYDKTKDGWTPLHYASANGNIHVSRLLMDRGGADVVFSTDIRGNSPLNIAKDGPTANALRNHKEQCDRLARRECHEQDNKLYLARLKVEFELLLKEKVAKEKVDIMAMVEKKQAASDQKLNYILQQQQCELVELREKVSWLETLNQDMPLRKVSNHGQQQTQQHHQQTVEIQALQTENDRLKMENSSLKGQVAYLHEAMTQCQGQTPQQPQQPQQQQQQHQENEILESENVTLRELLAHYKHQEEQQQKAKLAALRETMANYQAEIASLQESFTSFDK